MLSFSNALETIMSFTASKYFQMHIPKDGFKSCMIYL